MKKVFAVLASSFLLFPIFGVTSVSALTIRNQVRQEVREEVKEGVGEVKQIRKETREEFRQRIQVVADEAKRQRLESIEENMGKTVEKAVTHWTSVLDKLTAIVTTLKSEAEADNVVKLITTAEEKIALARTAVTEFSDNVYKLEVGDGKNFGQNVRTTVQQLRKDIKDVTLKVRSAVASVKEAYRAQKLVDTTK